MKEHYLSAEEALSDAFHTLAKLDAIGLGQATYNPKGGGGSALDQIAQSSMIIQTMRCYLSKKYASAILAKFIIVRKNSALYEVQAREKADAIAYLARSFHGYPKPYVRHVLAYWGNAINKCNDAHFALEYGVTERTLRNWRGRKGQIIPQANDILRTALVAVEHEFERVGIIVTP